LFKYRKVPDKSLPNVGGYKDFAPDGTWLQGKKTEKYLINLIFDLVRNL
jgi:hypothetical protein